MNQHDQSRLTHAPDMASIRACVAAQCLLVPEQATALLAACDGRRSGASMNAQDQRRLDEIRHRLERVTPGPWEVVGRVVIAMPGTPERIMIVADPFGGKQSAVNLEFLANSLDDITWLTERVRDLERALSKRRDDA